MATFLHVCWTVLFHAWKKNTDGDLHEIYFASHARGAHRRLLVQDMGSHMHEKSACNDHVGGWLRFSLSSSQDARTHPWGTEMNYCFSWEHGIRKVNIAFGVWVASSAARHPTGGGAIAGPIARVGSAELGLGKNVGQVSASGLPEHEPSGKAARRGPARSRSHGRGEGWERRGGASALSSPRAGIYGDRAARCSHGSIFASKWWMVSRGRRELTEGLARAASGDHGGISGAHGGAAARRGKVVLDAGTWVGRRTPWSPGSCSSCCCAVLGMRRRGEVGWERSTWVERGSGRDLDLRIVGKASRVKRREWLRGRRRAWPVGPRGAQRWAHWLARAQACGTEWAARAVRRGRGEGDLGRLRVLGFFLSLFLSSFYFIKFIHNKESRIKWMNTQTKHQTNINVF
jgi:hypothetical protein